MNLQLVDSLVHIINTLTLEEKQILQTKILSILPKKTRINSIKRRAFYWNMV